MTVAFDGGQNYDAPEMPLDIQRKVSKAIGTGLYWEWITGQITISVYLVARQEILNGRREHLDRQLALAKAAAVARFVAGVSP